MAIQEVELRQLAAQAKTSIQQLTSFLCKELPPGYKRLYSELGHAAHMVRNLDLLIQRMCPAANQLKEIGIYIFESLPTEPVTMPTSDWPLREADDQESRLQEALELDFESVYMYGTILLDQLADASSRICGFGKSCRFSRLMELFLKHQLVSNPIQTFWDDQKTLLWWHYGNFRLFRDKFVQHYDETYTYGIGKAVYDSDFKLSRLRHPALTTAEESTMLQSVYSIVATSDPALRRRIDGLNGMELFCILSDNFESFSFDNWKLLHKSQIQYGMESPSFDVVIHNLLEMSIAFAKFLHQQAQADIGRVKP